MFLRLLVKVIRVGRIQVCAALHLLVKWFKLVVVICNSYAPLFSQ